MEDQRRIELNQRRPGSDLDLGVVSVADVADAHRILAEITRMVKRIEDVKAGSAISRADFYRVMTLMGRAVDLAVEDPATREKIHDAWMEIRLA